MTIRRAGLGHDTLLKKNFVLNTLGGFSKKIKDLGPCQRSTVELWSSH